MTIRTNGSSRTHPRTIAIALAFGLISTAIAASPAPAATPCITPPPTFPTSQMTRGMTGVGYTVLAGETIVPFQVEILGVMPNAIYLGVDVVAAEITGPADFLATTGGAVGGMSGSPIYINGQLAGAVAWAIAEDRHIFGMTAAEDMVGMFTLPGSDGAAVPDRLALTRQVRAAAAASGIALDDGAVLEALPVPMGVSGLTGMPLSDVEDRLGERGIHVDAFRAGSVAAPSAVTLDPTPFAPGAGMGAALSYGDVSFYTFGTTTAVCNDVAIGFGHPMFWGRGRVNLGMHEVDVIAVDNGVFWGTKIGILHDAHGVMTQDRFAGVAGVFGVAPTTVPITSDVSSVETGLSRMGQTDVSWDDTGFIADAAYYHAWSNVTYVAQQDAGGTLTFGWTINGTREDGSPFTIANATMGYDSFGAAYLVWPMADAIYTLAYNGFEEVEITGVAMTGEITEANLSAEIVRVRSSSPLQPSSKPRRVVRAAPGDTVTFEVTLDPVDGDPFTTTIAVRVPRNARGTEEVRFEGGRGRQSFRRIDSFEDLLRALNGGDHPNDLIARAFGRTVTQAQDVIVDGRARVTIDVVR